MHAPFDLVQMEDSMYLSSLDKIDNAILNLLLNDARMSYSDIGEKVDNSIFAGESLTGDKTTFYGDIVDITIEKSGMKYYAIAYVVCEDEIFWSSPVECSPDFADLIIYE